MKRVVASFVLTANATASLQFSACAIEGKEDPMMTFGWPSSDVDEMQRITPQHALWGIKTCIDKQGRLVGI